MHDYFRDDPVVARWVHAQVGAIYGGKDVDMMEVAQSLGIMIPEEMTRRELKPRIDRLAASLPPAAEAKALLKAYIAEEIAALTEHLEVIEMMAEERRTIALRAARIDLTESGCRVLQYNKTHERACEASLRRLDKLRNPQGPGPRGRPPTTGAPRASTKDQAAAPTGSRSDAPPSRRQTTTAAPCRPLPTRRRTSGTGCERRDGDPAEPVADVTDPRWATETATAPQTGADPTETPSESATAAAPAPDVETTERIASEEHDGGRSPQPVASTAETLSEYRDAVRT